MTDVAIVHDYLTQFGGAERVVAEMRSLWPQAPIYTTMYRPDSTFPEFGTADVRTSRLDRLPIDRGIRALAPLMPAAVRDLGVLDHDLVVSSSSGWAHGVRTAPDTCHVVYCHNPPRWLYETEGYLGHRVKRALTWPLRRALERWDRCAARRPDLYVVNSRAVADKVRATYGIEAPVVHPPVDVERFAPTPRGERLLVVSRLLPYKRVDLAVAAATSAGWPLDVVGEGPELERLRALAGPTVRFHGRLPDAEVTALIEGCAAFLLPGAEDFGITPVEANAAGKPVVAFARGGALETVADGVTGVFFHRQEPQAVEAAIRRALDLDVDPRALAEHATQFSREAFRERLCAVIDAARGAAPSPAGARA